MSFGEYSVYREADVEWLTVLPSHWQSEPLKLLASRAANSFVDGDWIESPYITPDGVRLIQTGNVGVGEFKEQGYRFISESTFHSLRCTEVKPGDVLICRLADPVGRACLAPDLGVKMITSVDVCILKTRRSVVAKFIVYLLSSTPYLAYMEAQCRGGTRDRVSRSFLGSVKVPVPPVAEQVEISRFLDREIGKIDALVDAQERLIELLEEKRQAVISRAVTKGLGARVSMMATAFSWPPTVPAHWELKSLKYLSSRISSGKTPSGGGEAYVSEGISFIRSQNVYDDGLRLDDVVYISEAMDESMASTRILPGDILLNITGASIGRSCIVPNNFPPANVNQHVCAIRLKNPSFRPFVSHFLKSSIMKGYVDFVQNGAAREGLNFKQIGDMAIPIPPMDEQRQIVEYIERSSSKFDQLIDESKALLTVLRERRLALISAAVTGQINVHQIEAA